MRADGVQAEEDEDQRVGNVCERKPAIRNDQSRDKQNRQRILKHPVAAIDGMKCPGGPIDE